MEMQYERQSGEFIVQMGKLICTEARDISRDETANRELKDKIDNASLRKSNMKEIIKRINNPQIHVQNQTDRCENTSQTIDLHSQNRNEDERRTVDSGQ